MDINFSAVPIQDIPQASKFLLSDNAIDLVQKILTQDPARISAVEVFNHPWVRQVAPIPDFETLHRVVNKPKSYSHTPTQVLSYHTINAAMSLFIYLDRDCDGCLSSKDLNTCMNDMERMQ